MYHSIFSLSKNRFRPACVASQELNELREDFSSMDVDGDGEISGEEMKKMMIEQMASLGGGSGPTQEEVEKYVAEYDIDGNKSISFEEYVSKLYNLQSVRLRHSYFNHRRCNFVPHRAESLHKEFLGQICSE